jgi:hypothetical protein
MEVEMVIVVPQDATVARLISAVEAALPEASRRQFRLNAECRLDGETPFTDVLAVAKAWGVTCVPGLPEGK